MTTCEEIGLHKSCCRKNKSKGRGKDITGTYNVSTYMYENVYNPMLLMYTIYKSSIPRKGLPMGPNPIAIQVRFIDLLIYKYIQ